SRAHHCRTAENREGSAGESPHLANWLVAALREELPLRRGNCPQRADWKSHQSGSWVAKRPHGFRWYREAPDAKAVGHARKSLEPGRCDSRHARLGRGCFRAATGTGLSLLDWSFEDGAVHPGPRPYELALEL